MKKIACVIPSGGAKNTGTTSILKFLRVREYADAFFVASSATTTALLHCLDLDGLAEHIWLNVIPQKKVWALSNLLVGRPVSDGNFLMDEVFRYIPMWRFDTRVRQDIYVALYHPKENYTEYVQMTRRNAKELARASCHLPFFSDFPGNNKGVQVGHDKYCDGGTQDIFPEFLVRRTHGYDNIVFVANFPYQWIPDEIPGWMRRLAARHYGAEAPGLDRALRSRRENFVNARRNMSTAVREGKTNLFVLGPKRAQERYPVSHCGNRREIQETLIAGELLARKDEKAFHTWIDAIKEPALRVAL